MFLERPKKDVTALIPYFKQKGIAYEISDCTLPGEEVNMAHVEFLRELSPEEIEHINNLLDNLYGKTQLHVFRRKIRMETAEQISSMQK